MVRMDLTGQKFGRLTVVMRTEKSEVKDVKWLCKCDCGNNHTVSTYNLRKGLIKSCGCLRKQRSGERGKETIKKAHAVHEENYKHGTYIPHIENNTNYKTNTTGVRGVYYDKKRKKYCARIMINKTSIHLGYHDTLEQAKEAREEGEKKYYKPIIESLRE